MMKKKIGEEMGRWLEIADSIDKWHDKISAKERRILMTSWTGQHGKSYRSTHVF